MFIDMMLKRNKPLIDAATMLHQNGDIPANTYVLDIDSIRANVKIIQETAERHHVNLYYMTKQLGRHYQIGRLIEESGINKAVAVDIDEAVRLHEGGCAIGNIGHLVQPSKSQWEKVMQLNPEIVTLFSFERAKQLSDVCLRLGIVQEVILRVISSGDAVYPGQFGGFRLDGLAVEVSRVKTLQGIRIVGVTSFPVFQIDEQKQDYFFTENINTLLTAKVILEEDGIVVTHLNAPGATSCHTIPLLEKHGVTHGEPGHALTGTTPLHAYHTDLPEKPAILYVSEISHMDQDNAYTIAGGFYSRSNMTNVLYGSSADQIVKQRSKVNQVSNDNIDYYGSIKRQAQMAVGDTAVYAFRAQIFVTRAHVAYVENIESGTPKLVYFQHRGH